MRTPLLIALAAATALSSPAAARPHHGGDRHHSSRHHDSRHHTARHHGDRHHNRHVRRSSHHRYSAYVAPYRDWNYSRVSAGYRLRPAFYGSRYRISDYGAYGLRAPGRYLRWVRYGPDLLLVDVRYGRVVQVIPGRFY